MPKRTASEMFETLKEMAEDLFGDDDQQKETYVTEHMKRMGYRMRVIFEDNDDDDSGKGDSFTSSIFGGGKRERRTVEPRRPSSGGFGMSQYGS